MSLQIVTFAILALLVAGQPVAAAAANSTASNSTSSSNSTAKPTAKPTASPSVPILQPNTSLNEFENATAAGETVDPGDEPAACPLTSKNVSDADMQAIKTACDTSSLNLKNSAGSPYCLNCGCALDLAAYKAMTDSSQLTNTTDDDVVDACGQWVFTEAVNAGALDANAVAALKVCAPIDFVCQSYSKKLNSSYITSATEDQFSTLGSGVSDAVQSAAGNASAAAAAAAHAARSSAGRSSSAALLLLLVSAVLAALL